MHPCVIASAAFPCSSAAGQSAAAEQVQFNIGPVLLCTSRSVDCRLLAFLKGEMHFPRHGRWRFGNHPALGCDGRAIGFPLVGLPASARDEENWLSTTHNPDRDGPRTLPRTGKSFASGRRVLACPTSRTLRVSVKVLTPQGGS